MLRDEDVLFPAASGFFPYLVCVWVERDNLAFVQQFFEPGKFRFCKELSA